MNSALSAAFGPASLIFDIPGLDDLPAAPLPESPESRALRFQLAQAGQSPAQTDLLMLENRLAVQSSSERIALIKALDQRFKSALQQLAKLPAQLKTGIPANQVESALEPVRQVMLSEASLIKALAQAGGGEALAAYARLQLERLGAVSQLDGSRLAQLKAQLPGLESALKLQSLAPLEKLAWIALNNSLQLLLQAWFGLRQKFMPSVQVMADQSFPVAEVKQQTEVVVEAVSKSTAAALRLPPLPLDKITDMVAVSRFLYKLRSELRQCQEPALREALSEQIQTLQMLGHELQAAQRCRLLELAKRQFVLIERSLQRLPQSYTDPESCQQDLIRLQQQRRQLQTELDKLCQSFEKSRPASEDFPALQVLQALYTQSLHFQRSQTPDSSSQTSLNQMIKTDAEQTLLTQLSSQVLQLQAKLEHGLAKLELEQATWRQQAFEQRLDQNQQVIDQLYEDWEQLNQEQAALLSLMELDHQLNTLVALEQRLSEALLEPDSVQKV